ncbi:hypothetical protein E2320_004409 [Naja naja]|nr:hypothetical protein E2320_004409 [Naja naja]
MEEGFYVSREGKSAMTLGERKGAERFCGVPVPLKHATAKVMKYKVGQKLTFKHLNGSQARAPIPGIITCENSCGIAAWSSLNPQCTDDIGLVSGKQCLNAEQ